MGICVCVQGEGGEFLILSLWGGYIELQKNHVNMSASFGVESTPHRV